jgi:hypothetical protein
VGELTLEELASQAGVGAVAAIVLIGIGLLLLPRRGGEVEAPSPSASAVAEPSPEPSDRGTLAGTFSDRGALARAAARESARRQVGGDGCGWKHQQAHDPEGGSD